MRAETWGTIIAAIAAVASVIVTIVIAKLTTTYNKLSSDAAVRAASAAEEQTKVQRQLSVDAAQPYVWVDVRPDDATGTLLNLVIGNSGPTVATNVRVTVDPPLPAIDQLRVRAEVVQARLAAGVSSLPPGRILTWPLGQGFNLLNDTGPQAHTFTVTADGPFGAIPSLSYVVDLADFRGLLDRPFGSLHQLTKAVQNLGQALTPARSGEDA